ncbi:MAG: hypothetical protein K2Q01_11630 [Rickettsiales bacterium]|nr:hypothetical protein [Rickettsiales bacterium]
MKNTLYVLGLLLLFMLPRHTYAQEKPKAAIDTGAEKPEETAEAPFGLKWGMNEADAKTMGLTLIKFDQEGKKGKQFTATGLPKVISDTEVVLLDFGYNDRLWLVAAISKSFDNDPYGGSVRARYEELSKLLENKYGKCDVSHVQDRRLYNSADEFLAGLKTGRSVHATSFKAPGVKVEISIGANSFDSGYYRLRYENTALSKEYQKDKKQHEGDAL